eukprot:SAG22_NODE_52_length_24288_cov_15.594568_9_plen_119_part_00
MPACLPTTAAALDALEKISLASAEVAEGAIASVVRNGSGSIDAYPITHFVPPGLAATKRRICFFKLDVEGFELHGLASAYPLFGELLGTEAVVENVVVEFGPTGRWPVAGASVVQNSD